MKYKIKLTLNYPDRQEIKYTAPTPLDPGETFQDVQEEINKLLAEGDDFNIHTTEGTICLNRTRNNFFLTLQEVI